MAIVTGTIVGTGQTVNIDLPVVRAPELAVFPDLQDDDLLVGFDTSENGTRSMTLAMLRSKMIGDGSTQPPILTNGTIQLVVDDAHDGTFRWDMPSIAGQDFKLDRRALGPLIVPEYDIISTGGFLLVGTSAKMVKGEVFVLTLVELQGGDPSIIDNSGGLFTGIVTVDNSIAYSELHKRKVIHIAGGDNHVIYSLPDVTTVDKNQIIPFESNGANNYQTAINTVSGQLIYVNGQAFSVMYMGFGEILWLQAGEDGWYIVAMHGNFLTVGEVELGWKKRNNSIQLSGQLLARADFPRLYLEISGYGDAIISEATWSSGLEYQGKFTLGPTTGVNANKFFRIPNVEGVAIRFTGVAGGRDPDFATRINGAGAGSYQGDQNKTHSHTTGINYNSRDYVDGGATPNNIGDDLSHGTAIHTSVEGGAEARMKNMYITGYIKC